jgi:FkbM family methyltransferase
MNLHDLKYLEPKSILDIGANVGDWSKQAKEVWPDAEIFMVEGNPECELALAETGFPFAITLLSDKKKEVEFYQRKCGGTSTGDSLYRENTDWYNDENISISNAQAISLDDLFVNRSGEFDIIKIDCQGSEVDILKGATTFTPFTKAIIMEIPVDSEHPPYNIGAPTRKEVLEYMESIGFKLEKVLESIVHPIHRYEIQQDVLFVRV